MTKAPARDERSLVRDERGAVMVMGLFLALAVLVGIGCVMGIGDAVIARDRSQEAADSTAFAGAVMHARGMNFISMINLALLCWTLVYVFLCWVDLLLSFILVCVTGLEQYQFTCLLRDLLILVGIDHEWCQDAGKLQKFESVVFKTNKLVFKGLKKVAPPLYEAQMYAAMAIPYVGLFSGAEVASEYDRAGMAMSLSMIPGGGAKPPLNWMNVLLDKIPGVQRPLPGKDGKPSDKTASLLQDRRIGLPVEAEPAYQLCIRGSRFILEHTKDMLGPLSIHGKTIKTWTGEEPLSTILFGAFQSVGEFNRALFCSEPKAGKADPTLADPGADPNNGKMNFLTWRSYIKYVSKKLAGPMRAASREMLRSELYIVMYGIKGGTNDKPYLQTDEYWRMNWPDRAVDSGHFAGPKKVSSYAYNGTDWFQIYALASEEDKPDQAAKTVSLAARLFNSKLATQAPPDAHKFFAQAEFYFDCPSVWQSSQCNKGSAAMYQMNWRARLRRVHSLNLIGDLIEVGINNLVMGTLAKKYGQSWTEKINKRFPGFLTMKTEVGREGWIKALRNDVAKIVNHRVFTGDHSSDKLLH